MVSSIDLDPVSAVFVPVAYFFDILQSYRGVEQKLNHCIAHIAVDRKTRIKSAVKPILRHFKYPIRDLFFDTVATYFERFLFHVAVSCDEKRKC